MMGFALPGLAEGLQGQQLEHVVSERKSAGYPSAAGLGRVPALQNFLFLLSNNLHSVAAHWHHAPLSFRASTAHQEYWLSCKRHGQHSALCCAAAAAMHASMEDTVERVISHGGSYGCDASRCCAAWSVVQRSHERNLWQRDCRGVGGESIARHRGQCRVGAITGHQGRRNEVRTCITFIADKSQAITVQL